MEKGRSTSDNFEKELEQILESYITFINGLLNNSNEKLANLLLEEYRKVLLYFNIYHNVNYYYSIFHEINNDINKADNNFQWFYSHFFTENV